MEGPPKSFCVQVKQRREAYWQYFAGSLHFLLMEFHRQLAAW